MDANSRPDWPFDFIHGRGKGMKTVYITGASAGLGRAIAMACAKDNYRVGLIARDDSALIDTVASIGNGAAWASADVSVFTELEAAAKKLEALIGPPDIWINDAMATIFSRFEDIPPDEFARATNVTFLGSVHGLHLALRWMKPRNRGQIIQIGSALAYRAIPLQAPYCAAKAAIRGAVDSLRCELMHDKSAIRITMVQMPAMNTPQFDWARRHIAEQPQPVPPIYAPEACAQAVLWATKHPERREVWVGKPSFEAIISNKFFPALMDFYLARKGFESQFEKPSEQENTEGNLYAPVAQFHHTEGHFSDRQINQVFWFGTSWWQEIIFAALALLIFILLIVLL
jgi:NAD(P)-dependent dehydrogenase (short-subunit alcohol dehydrogenase family)